MTADGKLPLACSSDCGCNSPALDRREFLRSVGATSLLLAGGPALLTGRALARVAGPFDDTDFETLVPSDKQLAPEWVRSLFERGRPTTYRTDELKYIGMPIGGVGCGQLYLGGDGKLWHWDILNLPPTREWHDTNGPLYAKPAPQKSPFEQGFALRIEAAENRAASSNVGAAVRPLDARGFRDITFRGQYPIGNVEFADADCPVRVALEAFSPFIPLATDDSSLPATILEYTIQNPSNAPVDVTLAGWLENPVALRSAEVGEGTRRNTIVRGEGLRYLRCTAEPLPVSAAAPRADIVFERFENSRFQGWTAEGTAFGDGPVQVKDMPSYMGDLNAQGERAVNTHNVRDGEDVVKADQHKGKLTSAPFKIERRFITFLVGGGAHAGKTCVNLLVDGKSVRTATGQNSNRMAPHTWSVAAFEGQMAQIEIVDDETGGWGQISVDDIVFSDAPREPYERLEQHPDFGSLTLALLDGPGEFLASAALAEDLHADAFASAAIGAATSGDGHGAASDVSRAFGHRLIGAIGRRVRLAPGESATLKFIVAWHFPRVWDEALRHVTGMDHLHRHYAATFDSAAAVARYVGENYERLARDTRLWRDTYYGGTLPNWLLERAIVNVSTAATATCYRFDNGRFYAWEGTYCCAGTCTHVWQYAQALARIFPALERSTREMIDFGIAFHADNGAMDYRAEAHKIVAHDGQAGTILRAYREHQMSVDDAFLHRVWPRVRRSIEFLMNEDKDGDGLLEGAQYNTLDAAWFGPMAWLSSLYLAAVAAGEQMAHDMDDGEFAARCRTILERGRAALVAQLFNGEYFIHRPDPAHPEANNTNDGCHIDQVFGQFWAHQLALPRVVPLEQSQSALHSLWKYSFTPDVGVYRDRIKTIKGGRWYAMAGEGGLLMCTFPKGGADRATGQGGDAWAAGYFNECMSGFEHQVASHMVAEGLVQEGLAVTRMIHDRYHAAQRNPFNEVECSNHYARAMASYATFLTACGYEYHGPRGYLALNPKLTPENFESAFTAAEGWGVLRQNRSSAEQLNEVEVRWGELRLRTLGVTLAPNTRFATATVSMKGTAIESTLTMDGSSLLIRFEQDVLIPAGAKLEVRLT